MRHSSLRKSRDGCQESIEVVADMSRTSEPVMLSYRLPYPFIYLFRIYFCTYVNDIFVYISVRKKPYDPTAEVRQDVNYSVRFTCEYSYTIEYALPVNVRII